MDLSLLPTPANEYNKQRTGAHFTVRSASSPSYSLTHRSSGRIARSFSEEKRESTKGVRERERYGTHAGINDTNKQEDPITEYQAWTGSCYDVKGQEKETSGHKMSAKLNQNGTTDKTITEFGIKSENPTPASQERPEQRRNDLLSKNVSPDWSTSGDMSMWSSKQREDITRQAGELEERRTGVESTRDMVMSSIQAYNSGGASTVAQERSPVSHISQTMDRTSKGLSLPSRLKPQPALGSKFTATATSFGSKGGQSILERIEKLYGSAGFGKAEDYSKIRDFSTPGTTLSPPQQKSHDRAEGGSFLKRFSSGEISRNSFPWIPQKDMSGSDSSLPPGRSRRLLGERWQGQSQSRYLEEDHATCVGKGFEEIGTMSLDRVRSRNTAAAQIRSARAAGRIAPESNTFLEKDRSISFIDSSELRDIGAGGSRDQSSVKYTDKKFETNGIHTVRKTDDGAKGKNESKSSSTSEDVFEFNSQKITLKTAEWKKEMLSAPSATSVKNKISQFEALSQRNQGYVPMPRRAMSAPTHLISGSTKPTTGGLKDKWEGSREGEGAGVKPERSLSVDENGLRRGKKEREGNDLVENEWEKRSNNCGEEFGKYSRLKRALEIPLNGGVQRQPQHFFIDETDFSKVFSPEEASEKDLSTNNKTTVLVSSDTSTGVPKKSPCVVSSPLSDDDKTPTNTPNHSPFLSPTTQPENVIPTAYRYDSTSVFTKSVKSPDPQSPPLPCPLATFSHSSLPEPISPDVNTTYQKGKKRVLDLDAWVAGLSSDIKVCNDTEDEDDDESTQKDEDSNYDSDSGESSVTITSSTSQSEHMSFCVNLSDLYNFAGVEYESENDSDDWRSTGQRSMSVSSDVSILSCVSLMPTEELDRLLEDVRNLGDNTRQDYDDVQVVVLHKEIGVGLGFSVAGGMDQNKPVTVHKVFHLGVAAQEGSIREGDQVLSINGTALCGCTHWEAVRVLRRAKTREMGVVVLKRGDVNSAFTRGVQESNQGPTQTQSIETDQCVCVHLEKNSRDLGFSLEGGVGSSLGNRPLTVQKIFQGGPVDKVFPGDEVVEIEGMSMVAMSRLEAWTFIRRLPPGPVDIVLRRPLKHLET